MAGGRWQAHGQHGQDDTRLCRAVQEQVVRRGNLKGYATNTRLSMNS